MFFEFFFFLCLAIYLISLVEVIGSYFLSTNEFGNYSTIYLCTSVFIPPLAPIFAWAIFSTAKELYDSKKENETEVDESFYGYIVHGFNSINDWAKKHPKSHR